ncbi:MAG: hypothetical protein DWQ02_18775 [Bacteroidetes bacterium]|nr:MAG: hypothetical protein DWQ02_18775 [Bacteroidota bacterium]
MFSRLSIQPKLLLLYSAGMAETIKMLKRLLCWNFVLVFTFGSPISRGHNFGGMSHCDPSGIFVFIGKV